MAKKIIKEQLIYKINGNSIKEPFLYIKQKLLNDLYYRILEGISVSPFNTSDYQKEAKIFFTKYFPNVKPIKLSGQKRFTLLEKDIDSKIFQNNFGRIKYTLKFKKIKFNGTYLSSVITINSDYFSDIINNFSYGLNPNDKVLNLKIKNNILKKIKNLYVTLQHELIHFVDELNWATSNYYKSKNDEPRFTKYYLKQVEFPTWLSNSYSSIKALTKGGRYKIPYKIFRRILNGQNVYFNGNSIELEFMKSLFRNGKEKEHLDASKRLFKLLNKNYLIDDGYKLNL